MKRVFLFVLDSLGIGEMPDAADFGDKSCNTLRRIAKSKNFSIPNLLRLGIGNIDGIDYLEKNHCPLASVARLTERSRGKDTTIGHWELAGLISNKPMPTYPNGFPDDLLNAFSKQVGRGVFCNKAYSGTEVIRDYGKEHLESGKLIVYTSADSVFQIAAHTDVVPVEQLYDICRSARALLTGEHGVGRVIARPFAGEYPNFYRTSERRDFSLQPPRETVLDAIVSAGKQVRAVGKIYDIFAGRGITWHTLTHSNAEGMQTALGELKRDFEGLCFINLVDFDMVYGHRQDVDGYAAALSEFDRFLGAFISQMDESDVLMITADHGCDPGDESTDHSREYTPFIMYSKNIVPVPLGTRTTMADVAATVAACLNVRFECEGKSMLEEDNG